MDNRERLKIVIMQMLEHNETHVEKYEKWADFAKTNQLADEGALIDEAKKFTKNISAILRKKLNHLALTGPAGNTDKRT